MEIIARPHVAFECIVNLRGKRRNMARVPAYWHIPAYLQTNGTICTIKYLIHLGLINTPNGALRTSPPPPITIAASYSSSKTIQKTISRNKMLSFRPKLWPPGANIFPLWTNEALKYNIYRPSSHPYMDARYISHPS
jgi:hypothetical protein